MCVDLYVYNVCINTYSIRVHVCVPVGICRCLVCMYRYVCMVCVYEYIHIACMRTHVYVCVKSRPLLFTLKYHIHIFILEVFFEAMNKLIPKLE